MKQEKEHKNVGQVLAAITPRSQAELIALIEAGWLSAQRENLIDGEVAFAALHDHLDQLAAQYRRPLPVIYV